ncbi:MAG: hypothetical protein JNJ83_18365 [Verrucomicrobiaceae bacterium]|nr:hypothetical protein [Verrucomicrobiaceae bacterium]
MNTPASNSSSTRRSPQWPLLVGCIAAIVGVLALKFILPPHWHALLELKNTGTKSMTVVFGEQTTVTKPGESWKGNFRAGDTISIASEESANAWFNLQMPDKNPKPWTTAFSTAQHWTAEVNADDPANIRVEKRVWTEVTNPPSPLQPWP